MSEPEVKQKSREPLNSTRMSSAEYQRTVWRVTAEKGTTIEEVQNPRYWSTVAVQIKPMDLIDITTDDMAWYAQLLVVAADRTWAKVVLIMHKELVASDLKANVTDEYEVEFAGPHLKHRIIRKRDRAVIKDKISLLVDANRELASYLETIRK